MRAVPEVPSIQSQAIRDLLEVGEESFADAAFCTGDFSEARRLIEQALERAQVAQSHSCEAMATERLGLLLHYDNITKLMGGTDVSAADIDAEESLFQRALAMHREMFDVPGAAQPLFGLGLVAQVLRHDWNTAIADFREALTLVEAWPEAIDLYTQSEVHRHVGFYYAVEDVHLEKAVKHLQRSLDLRIELGDPRRIPSGLETLGEIELAAGNTARGLALLQQAVTQSHAAHLHPQRIQRCEQTLKEAKAKHQQ
jgi:tetratricopeptide (TPR) repeat protein